jgi:hypothetical protein
MSETLKIKFKREYQRKKSKNLPHTQKTTFCKKWHPFRDKTSTPITVPDLS